MSPDSQEPDKSSSTPSTANSRKAPSRIATRITVAFAVGALLLAWAGDLFLAGIVEDRPVLLIALNARNRNLILAAPNLSAAAFFIVGFMRLTVSDLPYFLLGRWHGDRAIAWTERRSRTYGPLIRDIEKWFGKYAYFFIFVMPNNIISALSGAAGIKPRNFVAVNIGGTIFRLVLIWKVGEHFESPIKRFVGGITEYKIPVFIVSGLALAWTIFGEFRGDNGEIAGLKELADDSDGTRGDEETSSGSDIND